MPTSFLDLPPEIRNEIYKYLVVQEEIICCVMKSLLELPPAKWKATKRSLLVHVNILRVNKVINHEAKFLLYSQNRFEFINLFRFGARFEEFLKGIGPKNASYIQHLKIIFPMFDYSACDVTFKWDYTRMVKQISKECTDLQTLELDLGVEQWWELQRRTPERHGLVLAALRLLDTRLRKVQSLKEIRIVADPSYFPDASIKREMEKLGWVVVAKTIRYGINAAISSSSQS